MPIYEYRCKDCGEEIEVMQSVSAKPLRKCDKCGGKLEKLISQNAFHLKGDGWYKTGYESKPNKSDNKSATKESKTEATKTSPKQKDESKKKADNKSAA